MAIAGLLVHTVKNDVKNIAKRVNSIEEMTTHGIQEKQYVIVVVKASSDEMEGVVKKIHEIEGVLTIYTIFYQD